MNEGKSEDRPRQRRVAPRAAVARVTLPALVLAATLVGWAPADGAVATHISVGDATTCAIATGGGLSCWGSNDRGQLGDGTTIDRFTPVAVSGLGAGVAAVSAGSDMTCAVTTSGGAKCWGGNEKGQLGDGTTVDRPTPVDVSGLTSGVAAIAAGSSSACALTTGGGVKCWGYNVRGTLGDGTFTDSPTPVDVVGLASGVAAITHGGGHACALLTGGGVKCWGANFSGELGNGLTADSNVPVDVTGLTSGVTAVSSGPGVGTDSCALLTTGAVKCWSSGIAGVGSTPYPVSALASGVEAIAVGRRSATVIVDGAAKLLFLPGTVIPVQGLTSGIVEVGGSPAFEHVCALNVAGEVQCFGIDIAALGEGPAASVPGAAGCVVGFGDTDFDRICDSLDPCASGVAGGIGKPSPRLVLTSVNVDPTPGNERLSFRTRFALPAGVAFGDLNPLARGARLTLVDPGAVIADRTYPATPYAGRGTAGWTLNGSGKRWSFTDATGVNGKLVGRLALIDKGNGLPGGLVELNVTRGPETVTLGRYNVALQVVFTPGDATDAAAGLCAQTNLVGTCDFNSRLTTLTCKP